MCNTVVVMEKRKIFTKRDNERRLIRITINPLSHSNKNEQETKANPMRIP